MTWWTMPRILIIVPLVALLILAIGLICAIGEGNRHSGSSSLIAVTIARTVFLPAWPMRRLTGNLPLMLGWCWLAWSLMGIGLALAIRAVLRRRGRAA